MMRRFAQLALISTTCGFASMGSVRAQGASNTTPEPSAITTTVITVEAAGPQLTRLHVSRGGVERVVIESSGFTITTDATGTTVKIPDGARFTTVGADKTTTGDLVPGSYFFFPPLGTAQFPGSASVVPALPTTK